MSDGGEEYMVVVAQEAHPSALAILVVADCFDLGVVLFAFRGWFAHWTGCQGI